LVVVSGGGRWNVPEVNATYEAIGADVLHTVETGAVRVTIGSAELAVERFRSQ